MSYSKITIRFNSNLQIGHFVQFGMANSLYPGLVIAMRETWVNLRTASFQVTTGNPTTTPGARSALNYMPAFNADYNNGTGLLVNININTITITSLYDYLSFQDPVTNADVTFTIENYTGNPFRVTGMDFLQADNPCENIKVSLTTSNLATKILQPFVADNTSNPIVFEWPRGQYFNLELRDINNAVISTGIDTPGLLSLNPDSFIIQINNSPNGATVTFNIQAPDSVQVQYSLDNLNWQNENVFSGILEGDYTVYVRDQFGCKKNKIFHIDGISNGNPFFYISKSLSIRFVNRVVWGDAGNYKNDENTLSYESNVKFPYCQIQSLQSADVVTTQFLSNYSSKSVKVKKSDGTEVDVMVNQKTNNIGIKDRRDARRFDLGNGKTGIYFVQGNTYDYDSGALISIYTLNGALPEWAVVGDYFAIGNAWFQIEEIVFDEDKNSDVIVYSDNYSGPETAVNIKAIYNRFDYEVYEFTIDMFQFLDETFQISLKNTDPSFPEIEYLSEKINVKVRQEDTVEIKYKNSTNTDIVYATGIENILRIPFTIINGQIEEENETYKTDTNAKLLSSELYEVDEFVFEPLTKEIWRKLTQALSHEIVFIDGVGYTKNSDFDTEGPLGDTNLYVLKARMVKNGNVYNSSGVIDSGYGSSPIEIPGFIESDNNGFIRY